MADYGALAGAAQSAYEGLRTGFDIYGKTQDRKLAREQYETQKGLAISGEMRAREKADQEREVFESGAPGREYARTQALAAQDITTKIMDKQKKLEELQGKNSRYLEGSDRTLDMVKLYDEQSKDLPTVIRDGGLADDAAWFKDGDEWKFMTMRNGEKSVWTKDDVDKQRQVAEKVKDVYGRDIKDLESDIKRLTYLQRAITGGALPESEAKEQYEMAIAQSYLAKPVEAAKERESKEKIAAGKETAKQQKEDVAAEKDRKAKQSSYDDKAEKARETNTEEFAENKFHSLEIDMERNTPESINNANYNIREMAKEIVPGGITGWTGKVLGRRSPAFNYLKKSLELMAGGELFDSDVDQIMGKLKDPEFKATPDSIKDTISRQPFFPSKVPEGKGLSTSPPEPIATGQFKASKDSYNAAKASGDPNAIVEGIIDGKPTKIKFSELPERK